MYRKVVAERYGLDAPLVGTEFPLEIDPLRQLTSVNNSEPEDSLVSQCFQLGFSGFPLNIFTAKNICPVQNIISNSIQVKDIGPFNSIY